MDRSRMPDKETFLKEFEEQGCVFVPGLLSADVMDRCRNALTWAIEAETRYHGSREYADYGVVQCCAMYDRIFIDLFDDDVLMAPFRWVLGDGSIVYAYASSCLPPRSKNFATRVHVDCPRLIPGYLTNMSVNVVVDDFTEENGGTLYVPGSHTRRDAPSEEEFRARAKRLLGKSGSVWYFNPRIWHSAGINNTDVWRHGFGMNMCRPFMKQRYDLPRMLPTSGVDLTGVSENALQKLGFHAQSPTSLDEYYAPRARRAFKQPYE